MQARTIHVGPRYEQLSPAERVEALEAAEGFEDLMRLPIRRPDPPEKGGVLLAVPITAVGVIWTVLQARDPHSLGAIDAFFYTFPVALIVLGVTGFFYYRSKTREYYAAKPKAFAACVVGKDFESTATEANPKSGKYVVRLVVAGGGKRTVDLLTSDAVLVDVGDVGLAGVRNGRLVDFKRLSVESG